MLKVTKDMAPSLTVGGCRRSPCPGGLVDRTNSEMTGHRFCQLGLGDSNARFISVISGLKQ